MTTTTATPARHAPVCTPATIPTGAALLLPCPRCVTHEAPLMLHLDNVGTFTCRECEEEFTVEDIQAIIDRWQPTLTWLAGIPVPTE